MTFDYYNRRAREARAGKILCSKPMTALLIVLMIFSLAGGAAAVCFGHATGWLALVIAGPAAMIYYFAKHELKSVPIVKNSDNINDILSTRILASLPKNPTAKDFIQLSNTTRSGRFLALRFGISEGFLTAIGAETDVPAEQVFEAAVGIMKQVNAETVGGAMLVAGLIKCLPNYELQLAKAKLNFQDIIEGITWYNYLHGLVKDAEVPRRTGGIARDLAFGYIPLLQQFGKNISASRQGVLSTRIHLASSGDALNKMVDIFSHGGRQNVALVGPYGSGRTTIVNAFADLLLDADSKIPGDLKFRQVFVLDASAIIGASSENRKKEYLVRRILSEAYAAKNIIICLDNAHLFFEEGTGSVDLSNVLLPILEAGGLRIILEMDSQKYLEISARNSALANVLNKIQVTPADEEQTMKVLMDQAPVIESQHGVICRYESLKAAYRFSNRYVYDVEQPGKAKILLTQAASFPEGPFVTEKSVMTALERMEGVKVSNADTKEERDKLLNLEDEIHQRMIDQVGAVKTVSDALRRAAAGVRNVNRPIGTFLFLGPTGVGKTELSKALAEVYFGGEDKIIRIDLNEYVKSDDVARLLEDGSENEKSLTAQIRKQPFSVVLLDEIEKADSSVLTTLLQMLDEGILRDIKGREVSFRDAIVIATSNAGANRIREFVDSGYDLGSHKEQFTEELISSGIFKPEFLNRFDEICLFKPLGREELSQIAELILAGVNKTLAPQKITVTLTDEAKQILIDNGYDPKMGARPMRRIVQKTVENLVAKEVLSGNAEAGAQIQLDAEQIKSQLD